MKYMEFAKSRNKRSY